jgi:mono/diheme cytochrome c family protein
MLSRISFLVLATAAGALGAAAVVAPFVQAYGAPAVQSRIALIGVSTANAATPQDAISRGRYVVAIGACNDCHTSGYMAVDGKTPEQDWLEGDTLGWQGPWGTTYPPNLRKYFQTLDEESWLVVARKREFLPPMPTPSLRAMSDDDLRAVYRFVRSLGPSGAPAPAHAPPGQPVAGPVVVFPAPPK